MIEHDDLCAAFAKVGYFGTGGGATIDRDEERGAMRLPAALDRLGAQAIAFLHPHREKKRGGGPVSG